MSDVQILAVQVEAVYPLLSSDKLELIKIGNYQTVEPKGKYRIGQVVAHFPPDMLIPTKIAEQLGVAGYLKDAIYPGDTEKSKCRVGAVRLRGASSFGFVHPVNAVVGEDLTERFHGVKYEPPQPDFYRHNALASCPPAFHIYTDIQNYRNPNYKGAFSSGQPVRITEKIHGTNSRIGIINGKLYVGTHKSCVKEDDQLGRKTIYWTSIPQSVKDMISYLAEGGNNVIAFGEIYGSKVQFMDYGTFGADGYSLFDISVNSVYLNWDQVEEVAKKFNVPLVPLLYKGPFNAEAIDSLVDGSTLVGNASNIRSSFKGREGVVITPLEETFSPALGGRLILKVVSVDYLSVRKSDSH